jgi:hypothetical protein
LTATLADRYFILAIEDAMTYRMWRLSEAGPGNLGLACTDDGLLFGRTPLIERRNGRFAVRERDEIERLLQHGHRYIGEADRLMPGLAVVARALNADDPCLARIAAVQLKLPDLPNEAARAAMEAEDSLIKYARDEGGSTDWDPALHPRTGTPPNPGWFAPTDGGHDSPGVHVAENQLDSRRTDAAPATNSERVNLAPEYGIDRRAETGPPGTKDKPLGGEFWSNVRAAVTNWLQEMVPEHDLESGRVVGERPRWQAIAPYVGIPIPTGAVFGGEAVGLPAVLSAIGLGGGAVEASTVATEGASEAGAIISSVAQEQANLGISGLSRYISASQLRAYLANPAAGSRFLGTAVHNATARVLEMRYTGRFIYKVIGPDFLDTTTGKFIELTTPRQAAAHLARPGYGGVTISTYTLP